MYWIAIANVTINAKSNYFMTSKVLLPRNVGQLVTDSEKNIFKIFFSLYTYINYVYWRLNVRFLKKSPVIYFLNKIHILQKMPFFSSKIKILSDSMLNRRDVAITLKFRLFCLTIRIVFSSLIIAIRWPVILIMTYIVVIWNLIDSCQTFTNWRFHHILIFVTPIE